MVQEGRLAPRGSADRAGLITCGEGEPELLRQSAAGSEREVPLTGANCGSFQLVN